MAATTRLCLHLLQSIEAPRSPWPRSYKTGLLLGQRRPWRSSAHRVAFTFAPPPTPPARVTCATRKATQTCLRRPCHYPSALAQCPQLCNLRPQRARCDVTGVVDHEAVAATRALARSSRSAGLTAGMDWPSPAAAGRKRVAGSAGSVLRREQALRYVLVKRAPVAALLWLALGSRRLTHWCVERRFP